jgi:hypothetical protein
MAKKKQISTIKERANAYLKRRPHRSFRRTLRRDYARPLDLPGYWAFTSYVKKILWNNRKTFILLAFVYGVLTALMVGIVSQDTYSAVSEALRTTSGSFLSGGWGEIGKASLLFIAASTGGFSQTLSESQQIYAGLIVLLSWLTSIWLLRNILAGHKVKLRDGLYSAGAPLLSTFIVAMVLLIQMLPLAIALIGYGAASASGLLDGGVEAMLFWAAAGLLVTLSFYWSISTFFALVIVTLPGMYPFRAIKTAGDLVIGRRLRILLRLLWMVLIVVLMWALTMIPIIMIDSWLKSIWPAIIWVPTIPFVLLALSSLTIVWVSAYIYLLYRKVVADESVPA